MRHGAKGLAVTNFVVLVAALGAFMLLGSCTQETQNKLSRSIQNWTGTNGVLDVLSDGKLMYRFIKIDKLTTASATGVGSGGESRAYRFGYGVMDKNFNLAQDDDEKKVYFEISDYSTQYIFYENPED